jgi:hypothetical protein
VKLWVNFSSSAPFWARSELGLSKSSPRYKRPQNEARKTLSRSSEQANKQTKHTHHTTHTTRSSSFREGIRIIGNSSVYPQIGFSLGRQQYSSLPNSL